MIVICMKVFGDHNEMTLKYIKTALKNRDVET